MKGGWQKKLETQKSARAFMSAYRLSLTNLTDNIKKDDVK